METEKPHSAKPKRKKVLRLVLVITVVLILLVLLLVPAFVSSRKGREVILGKVNSFLDGEADFASLSMGWVKGIRITDISFNDGSGRTSFTAKQIATKPHYGSILLGSLSFGETIIEEPRAQINLMYPLPEESAKERQQPPGEEKTRFGLPIKRIKATITDGNLKVSDQEGRTVEVAQINSKVNLQPPGQETRFDIDMAVVDKERRSEIHAEGQLIPPAERTGWSLKGTSGALTIEVNDLDVNSLGPLFVLAGVGVQAKGYVSADIKGEIKNGQVENLVAKIEGKGLDITAEQLKGDRLRTSRLDVEAELSREAELVNIKNLQIEADWLKAQVSGYVPTTFESTAEFIRADSKHSLKGIFECELAAAAVQIPHILGLKEGTEVTGGRLSGSIKTQRQPGRKKIQGQAEVVGLKGMVDGRPIVLTEPVEVEVEITSDRDGIKYDKLDLSAAFAKISCTGSNELLNCNAQVDLGGLQNQLGSFLDMGGYQMEGQLLSRAEVSSKKDKITAVGSSEIKQLRISSKEAVSAFEPQVNLDFSLDVERAKDIVNIDFIRANGSFGRVGTEDAVLALGKQAKQLMNLPISAKVDLAKLQPFAVLFASFPEQMQLAGTAESQISVSSKEHTYKIATDSTRIKDLKIRYPGQEPFEQEDVLVTFDAEVNPIEKAINIKKLELISEQIKIEKGQLNQSTENGRTKLEGQVDLSYDWAAVSTIAGPFLPKGLKLEGQRKDAISFTSEYPAAQPEKLLSNLSTKGKLGFEQAEYMGLDFGPTEVEVKVEAGLLEIVPFSSGVNNGQFSFAGKADFRVRPSLLRTPGPIQIVRDIQINDRTSRKLLTYLNPVFANALNVSGIANFNCERLVIPLAGATRNDLEVVGTVSIEKVRLEASDLLSQILSVAGIGTSGQDITIHPTRFVLQNGFLRYDDMQIDIGDNPVNFKGIIGLNKSLNMTVTLPYTTSGRTARAGRQTSGERISLPLKGTTDKPELDLGKLLEEQLRQQLEQKVREGLEELFK